MKLNQIQEIALAIILKQCATEEIQTSASTTLKQKLTELLDLLDVDSGNFFF